MSDRGKLDALPVRFPRVFRDYPAPGFEHGEGWADLLAVLFERLTTILNADPQAKFEARQIKEKFSEMRFYWRLHESSRDETFEEIREAVDAACEKSAGVCERCGRQGVRVDTGGWLKTRCVDCDERWE